MTKTVRIFGIIATCLFLLGVLFKKNHLPGAGVMLISATLIFILVFLPIQLVNQYRVANYFILKLYYVVRFISFFIIILGFTFKAMHLHGAPILLFFGIFSLLVYLTIYFILRKSGKGKLPLYTNDIIITLVGFSIFYLITSTSVSRSIGYGFFMFSDEYEKYTSGLMASNELIYNSTIHLNKDLDNEVIASLKRVHDRSTVVLNYIDSIRNLFAFYCTGVSYKQLQRDRRLILNVDLPGEFFSDLGKGYGLKLNQEIKAYTKFLNHELMKFNLQNPLTNIYLNTDSVTSSSGYRMSWDSYFFTHISVTQTFANISLIENNLALIENQSLNSLIGKSEVSEMTALLQNLSKLEAEKAIEKQQHELTRIKQEQAIKDLELETSKAKLTQQTTLTIVAFIGIGFVMVLLIISTRAFIKKQRDAKKLGKQKQEIEKNHFEISASIDYAKRLQSSILPLQGSLNGCIVENFVILNPKDKVSGDFYWWTFIEGHTVITAADCTGHGVPGAFMSMLGISLLREIVTKEYITHPGVILRRLRKDIVRILKQKGEVGEQKDGMDIAIISINNKTKECQFAGANNPLYLIRNKELMEYKPDKMPIAIYQRMDNFTTHDIQLEPNDQLYLFSDGFPDQFGGPNGKKFKYKPFKKLLLEKSELPLNEQKVEIENAFTFWKGEHEQIDDVVIVGVKV